MTAIRRVGVLGCGLMGSGIAQVAAMAGYETLVRDVAPDIWSRARANIERAVSHYETALATHDPDRDKDHRFEFGSKLVLGGNRGAG